MDITPEEVFEMMEQFREFYRRTEEATVQDLADRLLQERDRVVTLTGEVDILRSRLESLE